MNHQAGSGHFSGGGMKPTQYARSSALCLRRSIIFVCAALLSSCGPGICLRSADCGDDATCSGGQCAPKFPTAPREYGWDRTAGVQGGGGGGQSGGACSGALNVLHLSGYYLPNRPPISETIPLTARNTLLSGTEGDALFYVRENDTVVVRFRALPTLAPGTYQVAGTTPSGGSPYLSVWVRQDGCTMSNGHFTVANHRRTSTGIDFRATFSTNCTNTAGAFAGCIHWTE